MTKEEFQAALNEAMGNVKSMVENIEKSTSKKIDDMKAEITNDIMASVDKKLAEKDKDNDTEDDKENKNPKSKQQDDDDENKDSDDEGDKDKEDENEEDEKKHGDSKKSALSDRNSDVQATRSGSPLTNSKNLDNEEIAMIKSTLGKNAYGKDIFELNKGENYA